MEYSQAHPKMVEVVKDVLEKHHPHLDGARIAVVCRDVLTKRFGKLVGADASLVSGRLKPLLKDDYHFCITVNLPLWNDLSQRQKFALIDHELCHFGFDPETGKPKIIGHDMEEFAAIIERHGIDWRGDDDQCGRAVQAALFHQGSVVEAPELVAL